MAGRPRPIGEVLVELMARRGFARQLAPEELDAAWRQAAGPLASQTSVGAIRRGRLEILVAHSTLLQELAFRKPVLLAALAEALPDTPIRDLRFRVGHVV